MSAFCLPTAWVSTRRTKSGEPAAMLAFSSATSMKLSSTELICSRDTCLSSAMAMPSFCTSRASSCFSTFAASASPRLISRIAARCVPARSSGLSAIGGDPLLHDLRGALRVLTDEGARRSQLLLEAGLQLDRVAALRREAQPVIADIAALRSARGPRPRAGQRLHQRAQHQEGDEQHQARADALLGELRDPGVVPHR